MTKKEALTILSPKDNTEAALKQAYRAAALKYHPDHGGDENIMKLVNAAYELLKNETWTVEEKEAADMETPLTETLKAQWDHVKYLKKINGEIVGSWIWLTGETWRYKKLLKDNGFRWSPNKKAWYWHEEKGYKKNSSKQYSMDEIRLKYGTQGLRTENINVLYSR